MSDLSKHSSLTLVKPIVYTQRNVYSMNHVVQVTQRSDLFSILQDSKKITPGHKTPQIDLVSFMVTFESMIG